MAEPTTSGNFRKTPFHNVLLYTREKKLTGSFVIRIEPEDPELRAVLDVAGESVLVVEGGLIAAVRLPRTQDTLAWVLRELGALSEAKFKQVQEALARPGAEEIPTLLRLRACDPVTLDRALREQTRRKVLALFGLAEGTYAYFAKSDLLDGADRVRIPEDVLPIVWRGLLAHPPDDAAVEPVIQKIGQRALRLKNPNDFDRFEFGPELGLAATQLRTSPSGIGQLAGLAGNPEAVRAMVYLLALTRQIEVVSLAPGADGAPEYEEARASVLPSAPSPAPTRATPPTPPVPTRTAQAAPPPVPTLPVPTPPPVPAPVAPPVPVTAPVSTPVDAGRVSAVPSDPPASVRSDPKVQEAVRHLGQMENQNYFEMFSVPMSASTEDIRQAFTKIATPWHPDRAQGAELRALYTEIFSHYNAAHATLTDEKAREQYEESMHGGGGTPAAEKKVAAVLDTVHDMHRAEVALKRKDHTEAERLLRRVVELSPDDMTALLLLAQCLFEAKPDEAYDEAQRHCAAVIRGTEDNDRAFYLMGLMLKHRNDKRAYAFFKSALEANPQHLEAQREIRLAELRAQQRREQASVEGKITGFFNKLLKR